MFEKSKITDSEKTATPRLSIRQKIRQHKRAFIICIIIMLVSIALAIGLGVGLTHGLLGPLVSGTSGGSSTSNSQSNYVTTANGSVIWQPPVGSTYQIVLSSAIKIADAATSISPNVDIFEIDMFGNTNTTITKLHNLGKKVICYFSAGSYESYRPDSSQFQPYDLGNDMAGWPGEKWLRVNSSNVRSIMAARIQLAASKGCDAVDPDNMDGYVSIFLLSEFGSMTDNNHRRTTTVST